ncbi:helix-turn-helix transcriptional regulator [Vibrio sp. 404]|uniref:Helix-turn-helix transcriptional regulator n=1 Tax=Vibrio marinisediminis TaxID=2758441 RepID=A0A7W2ISQ4_9VIBR|nr:helix-turn-helix transcriptional regulator [Vibrio marinisediminis]
MKPTIENVLSENNFNWIIKEYHCRGKKEEFTCPWHYHSEYELMLYRDKNNVFQGRYFAGDSIGEIHHNSMQLYGPGLPHLVTGRSDGDEEHGHHSLIFWFRHQWLESLIQTMPELKNLRRLLKRAAYGLQFSVDTAEYIYQLLSGIEHYEQHHQLMRVLQALCALADDESTTLSLNAYGMHEMDVDDESTRRVELARQFIEKNYAKQLKIEDLCSALHLSESSAYRLFERHFLESFSEHLKRFRIGKACEMLVNSEYSVAIIAELAGFNNLSNFNRQFKAVKDMTPSAFRAQYNSTNGYKK